MVATERTSQLLNELLFELLFVESDTSQIPPQDVAADISTALDPGGRLEFLFRKPSGETFIRTGFFFTDGLDGIARYKAQPNEIDEIGDWEYQGIVELPGATVTDGLFHGAPIPFKVSANLRPPGPFIEPAHAPRMIIAVPNPTVVIA